MGKPNFSFQKRQKELAKKKKNEEKRQRKLEKGAARPDGDQQPGTDGADARDPGTGETDAAQIDAGDAVMDR